MSNTLDNLNNRQKAKLDKINEKTVWGIMNKKVFPYPDELFDALRPYSVAGFPASIMVHIQELCNGYCYDRAELMSLAFKDCEIIHATIESLRIIAGEKYATHAFVRTPEFGGNKMWIVDTSAGLIYDEDFYFEIQKPKIKHIIKKDEIMQFRTIKDILAADFENDKYALPMIMPFVENIIKYSNWAATNAYKEQVVVELENFKKAINYDAILKEIDDDMHTPREKLDEKFQIVRDETGREISRGGNANPYYISAEQLKEKEDYYQSIKKDKNKMRELFGQIAEDSFMRWKKEYEELSVLADKRIEEIGKNPTANFYDSTGAQPE